MSSKKVLSIKKMSTIRYLFKEDSKLTSNTLKHATKSVQSAEYIDYLYFE